MLVEETAMAKPQIADKQTWSVWLSWALLVMAYATYGQFLHSVEATPLTWGLSAGFAIALSGMMTILWVRSRQVILLGFRSDVGYSIMVLVLASLAVVAVYHFRGFAYFMVLIAVSLLARIDTLILDLNNALAFLTLSFLSLLGLGLSWIPHLLLTVPEHLQG
jgi:hypothetical protein